MCFSAASESGAVVRWKGHVSRKGLPAKLFNLRITAHCSHHLVGRRQPTALRLLRDQGNTFIWWNAIRPTHTHCWSLNFGASSWNCLNWENIFMRCTQTLRGTAWRQGKEKQTSNSGCSNEFNVFESAFLDNSFVPSNNYREANKFTIPFWGPDLFFVFLLPSVRTQCFWPVAYEMTVLVPINSNLFTVAPTRHITLDALSFMSCVLWLLTVCCCCFPHKLQTAHHVWLIFGVYNTRSATETGTLPTAHWRFVQRCLTMGKLSPAKLRTHSLETPPYKMKSF